MRAAVFNGPKDIDVADRPDPVVTAPTDAVVRVVLACVCGSDLWYYRGDSPHPVGSIGHEFIGVVEDVGAEVTNLTTGDLVIAPFIYSDGTCAHCQAGVTISCVAGGTFGDGEIDGGQGEAVRVPLAGTTLVKVPGSGHDDDMLKSLLTLSDVMCTGHHAAVSAGVRPGSVVAVVGDGAVGLSAVLASARLGAERIIALSRNPARQELARSFGATEIVAERGEEANAAVLDLTGGIGVDAALECVGSRQSMVTAFAIARPGSTVGVVGVPHDVEVPFNDLFFRNVGWHGGPAPTRIYIPQFLDDVLEGGINPGRVLDFETDLEGIADAYAAMDERRPQVAAACGVDLMNDRTTAWSDGELARIGDAEELKLASARPEGSLRPYVTMWVVRAGDELYVRSAYGPNNPWYQRAKASGVGRIRAGGIERDVTFADAAPDAHAAIDASYHAKYDHYGPKIVGSVVGPHAQPVTVRLVPRDERYGRTSSASPRVHRRTKHNAWKGTFRCATTSSAASPTRHGPSGSGRHSQRAATEGVLGPWSPGSRPHPAYSRTEEEDRCTHANWGRAGSRSRRSCARPSASASRSSTPPGLRAFRERRTRRRSARPLPRPGRHCHQVRHHHRRQWPAGCRQPPRLHQGERRRLPQTAARRGDRSLFYQHRVDPDVPIEDVAGA
jgi:threonine dehydrogenase-like Zn-dependent dehydrogenase